MLGIARLSPFTPASGSALQTV